VDKVMKNERVRHKGLRDLIDTGRYIGLPTSYRDKLTKMISVLEVISSVDELKFVPFWNVHQLSGDRAGVWRLTVSRNWRLTFEIADDDQTILYLDLEDYH
jgi:proteic killer suppression protein